MKTMSIFLGIVLLVVALLLFTTENMWAACAGTGALLFALILIRTADSQK